MRVALGVAPVTLAKRRAVERLDLPTLLTEPADGVAAQSTSPHRGDLLHRRHGAGLGKEGVVLDGCLI
jgi:hypothetical protein